MITSLSFLSDGACMVWYGERYASKLIALIARCNEFNVFAGRYIPWEATDQ